MILLFIRVPIPILPPYFEIKVCCKSLVNKIRQKR